MFILPCEAVNNPSSMKLCQVGLLHPNLSREKPTPLACLITFIVQLQLPVSDAEFPEHQEYIQFQTAKKGEKKRGMVAKFRATKK